MRYDKMRFLYSELKEYIYEDYEVFIRMGFKNDDHLINATLYEYQFGEDFCIVEKICIYVFLALIFKENNRDYSKIIELIQQELISISEKEIRHELKGEYILYEEDVNEIIKL